MDESITIQYSSLCPFQRYLEVSSANDLIATYGKLVRRVTNRGPSKE